MIHAIVQARLGSTRLPDKVLAEIAGKPLLHHVVERLRYSSLVDRVIVATTSTAKDDPIEAWTKSNGIACFRGDEDDVLGRYYGAAVQYRSDTIVRITADDPFKDPFIMDEVIRVYQREQVDVACNNHPPSFPEGLDVEVFSFCALEKAHCTAHTRFEREHVTPFFYGHTEAFRVVNYSCQEALSHLRWTIDTTADLEMARRVYARLYQPGSIFCFADVLQLLRDCPEIQAINNHVVRSHLYR